jgi:glycosyltransferase involved in cell wall biosynthesis
VLDAWRVQGVAAQVIALPDGFPFPTDAALQHSADMLAVPGPLLIDGLAYGAFPEALAADVGPRATVLLHHPLCDEQGLDEATRKRLEGQERAALRHAAGVVATSPSTARDLAARFGVASAVVAIPGTDAAPKAELAGDPPRILAVGTVTPRKGYGVLVEALSLCRDLDWRCDIVGAVDRDRDEAARVQAAIEAAGLGQRITLCGARESMSAEYISADLFVSSSLHEGYGMAVVEAMAHGLPVVTTDAGALAETASCARLVSPGNAAALAEALRPMLAARAERVALGATCQCFAQALPGWDETARRVAQAVEAVRAPSVFSESGLSRMTPDAE